MVFAYKTTSETARLFNAEDIMKRVNSWYQEEGKDAVELVPGKVINIPAEVKHWHGAAEDSWMAHLAIGIAGEGISNEWCEPVSEEEYRKLK